MAVEDIGIVSYDGVLMRISHVDKFDVRPVMSEDGHDHLFNHAVIGVRAYLNPYATRQTDPDVHARAPVTFGALKDRMLKSGRPLVFTLGGVEILRLPTETRVGVGGGFRMVFDVKGGPKPLDFRLLGIFGPQTIHVAFEIECWFTPCAPENNGRRAILSSRWSQRDDISAPEYLTTRTTTGTTVFRLDFLQARNDANTVLHPSADAWRRLLFPSCPDGFQRANISTSLESDGMTVRWSCVDEQLPTRLAGGRGGNISKVEGFWKVGTDGQGLFTPSMRYVSLVCRAWGTPRCTEDELFHACSRICESWGFNNRLIPPFGDPRAGYYKGTFTLDIFRRFAQAEVAAVVSGHVQAIEFSLIDGFGPVRNILQAGINGRGIIRVPANVRGVTLPPGENAAQPGAWADDGTRGSLAERLVFQALKRGDCDLPGGPDGAVTLANVGIDYRTQ